MQEPAGTIELLFLGNRDLIVADAGRATGLLAQPKRFALLAYVAQSRQGRPISRDELVALFWPDATEQKARNALSQALSVIRREVGPNAIIATARELGIDPDVVRSDVGRFEAAASSGDDDGALGIYRGDFLPGFQLDSAREFQDWLDAERVRLRRIALACARRLIDRAVVEHDAARVLAIAERGLALDPFDEVMAKHAMLSHVELGNPGAGVGLFEAYAERLSSGLDLSPSPALRALTESIRARMRESIAVAPTPVLSGDKAGAVARGEGNAPAPRRTRRRRMYVGVAIVFIAPLALALGRRPARTAPVPGSRLTVMLDDSVRLRSELAGTTIALSRDGSRIAYIGGPAPRIYTRAIDELTPHAVAGTEDAKLPQFSPDGKWVAFIQNDGLSRIPLRGGPPVRVADSVNRFSWGDGDVIVFDRPYGSRMEESLYLMHVTGGAPEQLTRVDSASGEAIHTWPSVLPGGKAALFEIHHRNSDAPELAVVRLADRRVQRLGISGHNPRFAGGFLLFGDEDAVIAVPFDPVGLRVTGPATRVLDGVTVKQGGATELAIAENGTLLYVSPSRVRRLFALDRHGRQTPLHLAPDAYSGPRVSSDGKRLALAITRESGRDVWVGDLGADSLTQVTHDGVSDNPEWTGDGRLLWRRVENRVPETWWQTKAGVRRLIERQASVVVSPTMTFAVGAGTWQTSAKPHGNTMIQQIALDSAGRPTNTVTLIRGAHPKISPDGKWVAFAATTPGMRDVFVRRLVPPFDLHRISTDGATEPAWGADSRDLIYRAHGLFVAARLAPGSLSVTRLDTLFADESWRRPVTASSDYDVSPDGKQIILMKSIGPDAQPTIVFDWIDELRRRLK